MSSSHSIRIYFSSHIPAVMNKYSCKNFALFLLLFIIGGSTLQTDYFPFDEFNYSGYSLDISSETANARATHWKTDGSEIYVVGRYTENVASYSVSEPWNLSTATFNSEYDLSNEFGSTNQGSNAHGLYMRNDGQKMWVFNRTEIWGYTLTDPWDITTSVSSYYKNLRDFVRRGHDIDFHPDGNRIYIDDRDAQAIHEASLSTPWDITTLQWVFTLDISDQEQAVRGIEIIAEGTIMLLLDTDRKELLQYHLSEPWELKTATFHSAFDLSGQSSNPRGLSIHPDLHTFYITGNNNQEIYQYSRNITRSEN